MPQTFGQFLVNDALPSKYRVNTQFDKKVLNGKLVEIAREMPAEYAAIATKLKQVGDDISTLEGISVGLDDIAPAYKDRNKILEPAMAAISKAKTYAEKEKIILETQDKLTEHTKKHPGTLAPMALSGSRGNIPQLLKTVSSPVAALDAKGRITPWLISRSYSEGLSLPDFWVAGNEARQNTVTSVTSVAEPGDLAKLLANNMYSHVVTAQDCGTTNGILLNANDSALRGRVVAADSPPLKRGELITLAALKLLRDKHGSVLVRSPTTCALKTGVCSKCMGGDSHDKLNPVGVNVGMRAAQSMSEPLTQFSLNAKHGVRVLKGASKNLEGLKGVRQLLEVPDSFLHRATLAEHTGKVDRVEKAPHGGSYVHVGGHPHYVGPQMEVLVKPGQHVEAGDTLSDGVPKPDEVVKHKGLGAGRQYLAEQLHQVYSRSGAPLDRRHFELLVRGNLSHVRVLDVGTEHPELLRGDVVHYNDVKATYEKGAYPLPLDKAVNHVLGKELLHYTAGTELTPALIASLKAQGVKEVFVAKDPPKTEAVMFPFTRNPLANPDWLARMSFRYLKDSMMKATHYGQTSDLRGTHPIPAYAKGVDFGTGPEGRY